MEYKKDCKCQSKVSKHDRTLLAMQSKQRKERIQKVQERKERKKRIKELPDYGVDLGFKDPSLNH